VGRSWPASAIADSDEFNDGALGPQWQWHANPATNWMFPTGALGFVRLFNLPLPNDYQNFWDVPNLLLQKFPASEFTVTTKVTFTPRADQEKAGLIVMGLDYAYVSMQQKAGKLYLSQTICKDADRHTAEGEGVAVELKGYTNYLRVRVTKGGKCFFSFSPDGVNFTAIGEVFTAREGKWIGAKVGLFAVGTAPTREMGYADVDWFRVQKKSS
jgi:beta-xylosidase